MLMVESDRIVIDTRLGRFAVFEISATELQMVSLGDLSIDATFGGRKIREVSALYSLPPTSGWYLKEMQLDSRSASTRLGSRGGSIGKVLDRAFRKQVLDVPKVRAKLDLRLSVRHLDDALTRIMLDDAAVRACVDALQKAQADVDLRADALRQAQEDAEFSRQELLALARASPEAVAMFLAHEPSGELRLAMMLNAVQPCAAT